MTTEARIERLERNNRRLLAGLAATILLGIGLGAAPHSGGDIVENVTARKFTLLDAAGKVRATLSMFEGVPRLALADANETERAIIVASEEGPKLILADEAGKPRVVLSDPKGPLAEWQSPLWHATR